MSIITSPRPDGVWNVSWPASSAASHRSSHRWRHHLTREQWCHWCWGRMTFFARGQPWGMLPFKNKTWFYSLVNCVSRRGVEKKNHISKHFFFGCFQCEKKSEPDSVQHLIGMSCYIYCCFKLFLLLSNCIYRILCENMFFINIFFLRIFIHE